MLKTKEDGVSLKKEKKNSGKESEPGQMDVGLEGLESYVSFPRAWFWTARWGNDLNCAVLTTQSVYLRQQRRSGDGIMTDIKTQNLRWNFREAKLKCTHLILTSTLAARLGYCYPENTTSVNRGWSNLTKGF